MMNPSFPFSDGSPSQGPQDCGGSGKRSLLANAPLACLWGVYFFAMVVFVCVCLGLHDAFYHHIGIHVGVPKRSITVLLNVTRNIAVVGGIVSTIAVLVIGKLWHRVLALLAMLVSGGILPK